MGFTQKTDKLEKLWEEKLNETKMGPWQKKLNAVYEDWVDDLLTNSSSSVLGAIKNALPATSRAMDKLFKEMEMVEKLANKKSSKGAMPNF